jgi:hypothetical protein
MNGSNLMQGWLTLVGLLAITALVLTAFGIMIGVVKPADAFRRISVIMGTVIALLILPQIVIGEWMALTIGHKIGIVVLVIGAFLVLGLLRSRTGKGASRRHY